MRTWLFVALVACKHDAKPPPDAPKPKPDAAVADAAPIDAKSKERAVPTKVVLGEHGACAVMSDGSVRCWGDNEHGELGDGTKSSAVTPVTPKIRGVKDLVSGVATTCALLDDASVACWGNLGIGKAPPTLEPAAASGVNNAQHVFAIGGAACAATSGGAFVCWGNVDAAGHMRAGAAEHRLPTPVAGVDHISQLVANGVLLDGGDVAIWKDDGVPVRAEVKGVVEIASRHGIVCGRSEDGSTSCFGSAVPCPPKPAAPSPPPPKKTAKGKKPRKPAPPAPPPPPKVQVVKTALPPAKQLAFDLGFCVVKTDGHLQCLDHDDACKLEAPWASPAKIQMTAGDCALVAGGSVACWKTDHSKHAVYTIDKVTHATQLSADPGGRACAVADGGVWCWDASGRATAVSFP